MALLLALAIVLGAAVQDPRPQPRDPLKKAASAALTASISGRVTDAESGRPLSNAEVTASPLTPAGSDGLPASIPTATDEAGRYTLSGMPPGEYRLFARPGHLRATHLPGAYGLKPGAAGAGRLAPVVRVAARDALTGFDIRLPRAYAIEGRVVNERGQPLVHLAVRARSLDLRGGHGPDVTTDDRGRFRIFGLPPGTYRVCATPEPPFGLPAQMVGGSADRYVTSCYPASSSGAAPIVITASDVVGTEISLARSGTFTISGEVVDASGGPVPDATVAAARDEDDERRGVPAQVIGSRFVIPDATPGDYVIRASRRTPQNASEERGLAVVRVGAADVAGVQVALVRGIDVGGRLVVDDGRLPPSAAGRIRVGWMTAAGTPAIGFLSEPKPADTDLRFVLGRIYDPVRLATGGLPDGWAVSRVTFRGRDITDRMTTFDAGTGEDDLRIHLTARTAKLTVRAVDGQGQPAAASVVVMPVDPERRAGGLRWGREAGTGTYDAGSLVPGEYLVAAVSPALALPPGVRGGPDLVRIAAVARRLTLKEGDSRSVEIRVVSGEER